MDMQDIIQQAEENIRQAVRDYRAHTYQTDVLDDISDAFITRLAKDSSYAKQELRELFSKSPAWHPELDAIIINGTRTHDPDYWRIGFLADRILASPRLAAWDDPAQMGLITDAVDFFRYPNDESVQKRGIKAIKELAPKAYRPGKKLSRVFKALCIKLGVADETAGSEFQHLYAQFADELTSRKLDFKLFVSINPAHFLTMSNPKSDRRGSCLTSCHSLNSTMYEYNCGCTGYARDEVSFIVFTVADPDDEETLNNRKTTRQVFAYKPGNGILLQSRMYNTEGGVTGQTKDSKLYRDLIQREISALEGQPNLWRTIEATSPVGSSLAYTGPGFGGYPDWTYENFGGKVCIRHDCDDDERDSLEIGTWGLCVCCGEETSDGMYCEDCGSNWVCNRCRGSASDENDLYLVYNSDGGSIYVCRSCRRNYYTCCDHCGEYHADSVMEHIEGKDVCPKCLEEYYMACDDCGEYHLFEDMIQAFYKDGTQIWVCWDCRKDHYEKCEHCEEWYHEDLMCDAHNDCGEPIRVCEDCYNELCEEAEDEDEGGEAETEMNEVV